MKALIYLRVSTEGQSRKENSIPTQKEACLNYARGLGYEVDEDRDIYVDGGESGRTDQRRAFQEMNDRLENDPIPQAIIAYDISRIFRNGVEYFLYKEKISRWGKKFLSVMEPLGNEDNPANFMMEWMLAGFAEFRSRQDGEKIRQAMLHKAEAGTYPGKAPFGYKNVRGSEYGGRERRWMETDEDEAIWVRKAFDAYATGKYSLQTVAGQLASEGFPTRNGKSLGQSSLIGILRKKIYIGWIEWGGISNRNGSHPKIIEEETFWKVQEILKIRLNGAERLRKHSFPLRGLLWCEECGSRINAAYHRSKTGKRYAHYGCQKRIGSKKVSCSQSVVSCVDLENEFEGLFPLLELTEDTAERIRKRIRTLLEQDEGQGRKTLEHLKNRLNELKRKNETLLEKYLEEKIDDQTYESYKQKIERESDSLQAQIAKTEKNFMNIGRILDTAMELVTNCYEAYEKASPEDRKALSCALFARIGVSNGKISSVSLKHPYAFLLKERMAKHPLFQYQYSGGDGES